MVGRAGRRTALCTATLLAVGLAGPPVAAYGAAAGSIDTTAQGLRANISLLSAATLPLTTHQSTWTTGGAADTVSTAAPSLNVPVTGTSLIGGSGTVVATAEPTPGGGRAEADVAGLTVLGAGTVGADAIQTACAFTASAITSTPVITNLRVGGSSVADPAANTAIDTPGVLTGTANKQTATYSTGTGRLTYTMRGLDLTLSSGAAGAVAGGTVVVAESTCSGIVKFGTVTTTPKSVIPGNTGTPTVTVTNTGDIAAPNTVIKIPAPPAGYTVGSASTTGGGTCATGGGFITCTGVTVPGQDSVVVSLPVTIAASAVNAANWTAGSGQITAVSTPIDTLPGTTISASGSGPLVTAQAPASTSGSITVNPMNVAAGKNNTTTIDIADDGPSDAVSSTITIPTGNIPAGVSVVSATVGGNACTLGASAITCTGVTVPAQGSRSISIKAAATNNTPPGTIWTLAGITASLNGTTVTGGGRLLTVSDPDVNIDNGVSIIPRTAIPGGAAVTPAIRVANVGIIPATGTTISVPAPPAGYTVGTVSTTGGGTCTVAATISCTGVTVPAMGNVTMSIPVTLGSAVTANWSGTATAAATDSTGTATGTLVTADPQWTLGVTATGPAPRTVLPGGTATMTVNVTDLGPSDAVNAAFVVVAPTGTTFGTLTGTAASVCVVLTASTLRCTVSIGAADPATVLSLPLLIPTNADPATPVTGGCVSLDNNGTCGPGDVSLPAIQLRTPLGDRLTIATAAATIVPGTSGNGVVRLTSTTGESGLDVTVPLGALPNGFTVTSATPPTGNCTVGGGAVTCTGVDLAANTATDLAVRVAVTASVTPPVTWTATGIAVSDGTETKTGAGDLAIADNPAWTLTATVQVPPDNTVEPGGSTALRVTVTNTGPSNANPATFRVTAPNGTTFQTPPAPCTLTSATVVTCTTNLADGADTGQLVLPLTVAANADPFTAVSGGCVDLDGNPGCGGGDRVIPSFLLKVPFAQQVSVATTTARPVPGDHDTATVAVTASHGAQSGLTVTVPLGALPNGMTVTAATPNCTIGGGNVTCTGLTIADGDTGTITLTVAAGPAMAAGVTWTATGITVTKGPDTITTNGQLAVTAPPRYTLQTTATPPSTPIEPGDTGTLAVTVDNLGPSDATHATIGVIAPTGVTFLTPPAPCTLVTGTRVTCTFDLTAAGTPLTFNLPFRVDANTDPANPPPGGCIDNNNNGVCDGGDPGLPPIPLRTPLSQRLTVTTVPDSIVPGTSGAGKVRLTATDAETGLRVTIPRGQLPAGFTAGAATVPGGTCTTGASAITCTGVDLTANTAKDVTVPVAVASNVLPPRVWTATGIDVSDGTDTVTVNGDLASAATPQPGLTADVTGPADNTVEPGDTTAVTVVVRNTGPSDAPATVVTVNAPAGTTYGTLTGTTATLCSVTAPTVVRCTVTLVANAATPVLTLPLLVPANADPAVPLSGGCVDLDGNPGCNAPDVPIPPIVLKVPFAQRVSVATTTARPVPGDHDTATVAVTASHGAQSGLTVTVPLGALPNGMTVTAATPNCTIGGGNVTCTGLTIADGDTGTITLTVAAGPAMAAGVTWTATGITVTKGPDTITTNGQLAVTAPPRYTLQTTATPPSTPIEPGDTGTLAVTVDNLGPSDATHATIGVIAPTGVTFLTPPAPCTLVTGTRVTCTFDLTAAGTPLTFNLPFRVDANTDPANPPPGGCIDNNNNGVCDGGDPGLPPIPLRTPLSQRLTVTSTAGTIMPGATGTGKLTLSSTRAETGLSVGIPLAQLPAGFTARTATVPGGTCTTGASAITCTGVDLTANTAKDITVGVTVASNVAPAQSWTATGVSVGDGTDTVTANATLAIADNRQSTITATVSGPADDTVSPGDTTALTVVAHNAGPSDAPGVTFTVAAPAGTTYGTLAGQAATLCRVTSSTQVSCTTALAAAASTPPLVLPIVVAPNADPFTPVSGGCVDLDGAPGCGSGDTAVAPFRLKVPFARRAAITTTTAHPAPGTQDTGTVGVTASHGALTNLTVTIPLAQLPAGLTVTGTTSSATCTPTAGQIRCTGLSVADGDTGLITLRVAAAPSAAPGTTWTATGITVSDGTSQITADGALAQVGPATYTLRVTFTPPAAPIEPGGTGDLGVTVDNLGPADATGVTIGVTAPSGGTFLPPAAPCTAVSSTRVTCSFDLTAAAAPLNFTLKIAVPANATPGAPLPGGCADLGNDGSCAGDPRMPDIAVGTPFNQQVTVTTDPQTITAGTAGTARVRLTTDPAQSGLTVRIPLTGKPAGMTLGTAGVSTAGTCTADATAVTCTGVGIPAASTAVVSLPVTVSSGTTQTWTATSITVTNPANATATGSGVLVTTGAARYALTATVTGPAPGTVLPGTATSFTATIGNSGPSDATGAPVSVHAPVGTTFGSPLTGAAAAACTARSATLLDCTVTLGAGASVVWTLPVLVPSTADPAVRLTGGCLDLSGDGACGGTGDVALPDIQLRTPLSSAVTVSAADPAITPGTSATATVTVSSSDARTGLTIDVPTGTLPAGLTLTGANCPVSGGAVHCTGVDLTAGGSRTVTLNLTAAPGAGTGAWAPAVSVTQGTETAGRTVETATVGPPLHPLTVTVTGPAAGTVYPGDTGTLTVTVRNAGPSNYPGARTAFIAPDGTTFAPLGAPASGFCTAPTATLVSCTQNLAVESVTFTLGVRVPGTATGGSSTTGGCVDATLDGTCGGAPDQPLPRFTLGTPLSQQLTLNTVYPTVTPGRTGTGKVMFQTDQPVGNLTVTVPRAGLPAGFTVLSATGAGGTGCTLTPDIVCPGVGTGAGFNPAVSIVVAVAADLPADVTWTSAGITAANARGERVAFNGALITTGTPDTAVTYTVTAPTTTVVAGTGTTLDLRVRNAGPSTARGVVVHVLAPAQATFGPLPAATAAVCTRASSTRLDCTFELTPGADDHYPLPLLIASGADPAVPVDGGCVDADSSAGCGGSTDVALPTISVRRTLDQTVTVSSANPTVTPGTGGTTTVRIATADTRTGLRVTIPTTGLPAGMTVSGGIVNGSVCTAGSGTLTCTLDTTATAPADIVLSVAVTAGAAAGPVWRPAVTVAQGGETAARTVDAATVGTPVAPVTVTVTGPADGTVRPGGTADLAVTVHNDGPSDARGAHPVFHAPDGTTFLAPANSRCTLTSAVRIDCTFDVPATADLPLTLRISIPATADPGTPVAGGCYDANSDGSCTVPPDTRIPPITLATPLSRRVQLGTTMDTVTPGLTGTGVVTVTADAALSDVTVTVPLAGLPAGLTVTGQSGPLGSTCARNGTAITCTGVDLTRGSTNAVSVVFQAAARLRAGVTFTARDITLASAGESVKADGVLVTTGEPVSPIDVAVRGPSGAVQPGSTTTMTVTLTDRGPSDATGQTATVAAPSQTTFGTLSGFAARDCTRSSDTLLTCQFGLAADAAPLVWTLPLLVSATATSDDTIENGCVSLNGATSCAPGTGVDDDPIFAVGRPLAEIGHLELGPVTVAQGATGTATVRASADGEFPSLTLTVPLADLPDGMTVTGAEADTGACNVGTASVVCTGLTVDAENADVVRLRVRVAETADPDITWQPAGITLSDDADEDGSDVITAAGLLVSAAEAPYAVAVSVGTPSPATPAAGQTTTLPITLHNSGPGRADPYTMTVLVPAGMTHGDLPDGCVEGDIADVVVCTVTLAAGATKRINLPLTVDGDVAPGTTVTGGCVDEATGAGTADGLCGGAGDLALPDITTAPADVDLTISYENPKPQATRGGTIVLVLPYSNHGSESASDVTFTINPPEGVTLTGAQVLLDAAEADGVGQAAGLLDAECQLDPDGDDNTQVCVGPDAPVGTSSKLYLTLFIAADAPAGTRPVTVRISTTSPEGDVFDNYAVAQLTIKGGGTATPTPAPTRTSGAGPTTPGVTPPGVTPPNDNTNGGNGGGRPLPRTGQNLMGLFALSLLLVGAGVITRVAARTRTRRRER